MHRVELKGVIFISEEDKRWRVPNAPCGVESLKSFFQFLFYLKFLMHRVELKDSQGFKWFSENFCS